MARKIRLFVTLALALSVVAGFTGGAVAMTPADDADVGTDGFDDGFDSVDSVDEIGQQLDSLGPCPPHYIIKKGDNCI